MSAQQQQQNTAGTMPDRQQDGMDRTEELSQAQQAGYGNKGGLDQRVEDSAGGGAGTMGAGTMDDGSTGSGETANQGGANTQGGVTGGSGAGGQVSGSAAGATGNAGGAETDEQARRSGDASSGLDLLKSDMGDGPGSQSGASAGPGGTGQRT